MISVVDGSDRPRVAALEGDVKDLEEPYEPVAVIGHE